MIFRPERFLATLTVACLCNCATTKPDSTDGLSSHIDLPEQQNQKHNDNEEKLTADEIGGDTGETVSEFGSQSNPTSDDASHEQSPEIVSELADSVENQGRESSLLNELDPRQSKSIQLDSERSSKPESNYTSSTVDSQSETSDPSLEGKPSFGSGNSSDVSDGHEKPIDVEEAFTGSNTEVEAPAEGIITKDSSLDSDAIETARGDRNLSALNKPSGQKFLDRTDFEVSTTSEDPEEPESSPNGEIGFSEDDIPLPNESEKPRDRLGHESVNKSNSTSLTTTTSNLEFSDSNSESSVLEEVNAETLYFKEQDAYGTTIGTEKSTSIHLSPIKVNPTTNPVKSVRRYVELSQWLSRSSANTSSQKEMYIGHSDPKVSVELESYIDESPLVGIRDSVPWEYDSITELLRPREDASLAYSGEKGFDYETVRKFFGRKNLMSSTESNIDATPSLPRYDSVLQWFESRDSSSIPSKSKSPEVRNYSKVLNWIRNEGR